jgi:hypothetical protein
MHYSRDEALQLAEKMEEKVGEQQRTLRHLGTQLKTLKIFSTRPLIDQLAEAANRSNVGMMMYELALAQEKGLLASAPEMVRVQMKDQIHNLLAKGSTGRRHDDAVKTFYEVLAIKGKRQVVEFAGKNQMGPSIETMRRRLRITCPVVKFGTREDHFKAMAEKMGKMMDDLGIARGSVLCEHAEDESCIEKAAAYVSADREFLGF